MVSKITPCKWLVALAGLSVVLLVSRTSRAACTNDVDCPGTQCGGQVCDWNSSDPAHVCLPAGGHPGQDGWCTVDSDCKCAGLGATCVGVYCSFTVPPDSGATGSGGATGAGGSAAGTGGAASGTDAGTKPSGGGGGCTVGGAGGASLFGALATLAVLALCRRRGMRA